MKAQFLIVKLICVALFSLSCSHESEHHHKVKFEATQPILLDTSISKEYVCQIKSIRHIELRALEKGYLENYFVDEGKFVKKGQLMFQILPILYKAEQKKAQAEADFAEVEYRNTKALMDSNVVSKNELLLSKAKLEKAKAELTLANIRLGFTEIRAPFDGIMDKLNNIRQGSLLNEGDLITTISDISNVWVYFNVPEAEYLDFKLHSKGNLKFPVKLRMANNEIFPYEGVVETIEADFNNENGNIAFRATFKNPELLLRHGETGNIIIKSKLNNALIIPQKATFEVLNKKYVYVINSENKLVSKEIEISAELPDLYVVSKGITVNDKILLEGLRLVNENDKIEFEFKNPKEVINNLKIHAE